MGRSAMADPTDHPARKQREAFMNINTTVATIRADTLREGRGA